MLSDAREGIRALRREPGALLLVGMVGAQQIVVGMLDVLAVLLALGVLKMSDAGPGMLTAAAGIGALIGAVATVVLIGRPRLAPALFLGILMTGLPLAVVGDRAAASPWRLSSCCCAGSGRRSSTWPAGRCCSARSTTRCSRACSASRRA